MVSFDACDQTVLPWGRPTDANWATTLLADAQVLMRFCVRAAAAAAEPAAVAKAMLDETKAKVQTPALKERVVKGLEGMLAQQSAADAAAAKLAAAEGAGAPPLPPAEKLQLKVCAEFDGASALRASVADFEAAALDAYRASGAAGLRLYAAGQALSVRSPDGAWCDATVVAAQPDGTHELRAAVEGGAAPPTRLLLHPWNHAPRELPREASEALHEWWVQARSGHMPSLVPRFHFLLLHSAPAAPWPPASLQTLRARHAMIADALSGKRLDALAQCVPIEAVTCDAAARSDAAGASQLAQVTDVTGLCSWLMAAHAQRCRGEAAGSTCLLLTAPPAAGKTVLMSQLVASALAWPTAPLVPILVKVQLLQRRLLEDEPAFLCAWNWVDAYLRAELQPSAPNVYRFLRQALMARRALVLLDGVDEGGAKRSEIERHVTEVLAPQGHLLLCTSRPAGLGNERFARFHRLRLAELSEAQQRAAVAARLGKPGADALWPYLERLPPDTETGRAVTANPLMLSMMASLFEERQQGGAGQTAMPATVAEAYALAAAAMLRRAGAEVAPAARRLLEATFFEAHTSQQRVIERHHLEAAALGLVDAAALTKIRAAWPYTYKGPVELGQVVRVKKVALRGVVETMAGKAFKVRTADGAESNLLTPDDVESSGVTQEEYDKAQYAAVKQALEGAAHAEFNSGVVELVVERVRDDDLPLLTMLQADPLQLQSSHLSFQEYFAAAALRNGAPLPPHAAPWLWPAWWANALRLGVEMGDTFRAGLRRAVGVEDAAVGVPRVPDTARYAHAAGGKLSLAKKVGGHQPTSIRAVAELLRGKDCPLSAADLSTNSLGGEAAECLAVLLRAKDAPQLTSLDLSGNKLGGGLSIASALAENASLTQLRLDRCYFGREGVGALGEALRGGGAARLTDLDARCNVERQLGEGARLGKLEDDEACRALAAAVLGRRPSMLRFGGVPLGELRITPPPRELALAKQSLGLAEGLVLAALLKEGGAAALVSLRLEGNLLGDEAVAALCVALREGGAGQLQELALHENGVGVEGARAAAALLATSASLQSLSLRSNNMTVCILRSNP